MYDELTSILVDNIGLAEENLRPDATLDEAGMDSLALVELSLVLENRYGVLISDDELIESATIADIANLVAQRVSSRQPQATG